MPALDVTDYNHVRLTVSDIDASRAFYDAVFGFDVALEVPDDADEQTREELSFLFGGVIYQFGGGMFGLRPVAPGGDTFDEDRSGLDHLSFTVSGLDALHEAVRRLDDLGVEHEDIKDIGNGLAILEFRDPDNIALELSAPTG